MILARVQQKDTPQDLLQDTQEGFRQVQQWLQQLRLGQNLNEGQTLSLKPY